MTQTRPFFILISLILAATLPVATSASVLELAKANDPSLAKITIKLGGVTLSENAIEFISADGQFAAPYNLLKGVLKTNIKKVFVETKDGRKIGLVKFSHCREDLDLCLLRAVYKPQRWVEQKGKVAQLTQELKAPEWVDIANASAKIFDEQTAESTAKAKDYEKYLNYPKKRQPLDTENFTYIQLPFNGNKLTIPLHKSFAAENCRSLPGPNVSITCPNKDKTAYFTFNVLPEQKNISALKGKPYYAPQAHAQTDEMIKSGDWQKAGKYLTEEEQSQFFSSSSNMKCKKSPKKSTSVLFAGNEQCWGFTYNDTTPQASSFYKLVQASDNSVLETKVWVEHAGQVIFNYRLLDIALSNATILEVPKPIVTKDEGPNQYAIACQMALTTIYNLEKEFQATYQSFTSDLAAIGFDNQAISPYQGMMVGFNVASTSKPVGLVPNYNPNRKKATSGRMPASESLSLNSIFGNLKGATASSDSFTAYCVFPHPGESPEIWSIDQNRRLKSH